MDSSKNINGWKGWIVASGILIGLAFGALVLVWGKLPPEVPWLYSLPWGEQQLVTKVWFAVGFIGLLVMLSVSAWLAKILSKEDARAGILLSRGGFILTLVYILSFIQVLRLMI